MISFALSNDTLGVLGGAGIIAIIAAYALLVLGALWSSLTAPQSGGMKLVWLVFIVVAPFIGSLLWFLAGKRSAYA
ncbi:PLD nuclease N-terminal domain-containing protein [Kribbella sp. NPDC051770]|uniref:PLD nuclease N-terminal domain-containing protein n=1 Tax=Kribbella sp. NPDC051770 TaxID=3155413 RepID=UPI0034437497